MFPGTVVVQATKLNLGEEFIDLEMLTTLLPCKQKDLRKIGERPMIEVLEPGADAVVDVEDGGEEFDTEMDQSFEPEKVKVLGSSDAH